MLLLSTWMGPMFHDAIYQNSILTHSPTVPDECSRSIYNGHSLWWTGASGWPPQPYHVTHRWGDGNILAWGNARLINRLCIRVLSFPLSTLTTLYQWMVVVGQHYQIMLRRYRKCLHKPFCSRMVKYWQEPYDKWTLCLSTLIKFGESIQSQR